MRELSAPLPSVPPSTPASTVVHRSSLSQLHNRSSIPAPVALHLSPSISSVFTSPLIDHFSDPERSEQDGETSDSNSIEIISGYVSDSFVKCLSEKRDGAGNFSQGLILWPVFRT